VGDDGPGPLLGCGVLDAQERGATGPGAVAQHARGRRRVGQPGAPLPGDLGAPVEEHLPQDAPAGVAPLAPAHEEPGELAGQQAGLLGPERPEVERPQRLGDAPPVADGPAELDARPPARCPGVGVIDLDRTNLNCAYPGRAVEFVRTAADRSPGRELVEAMIAELEPIYGRIDVPGAPTATPADMAPPGGAFLVGYDDGRAVCCGGLKRLPDGACEIKRMYVVPDARGRGLAGSLLAALEDAARSLGYRVARLDTGPAQPHAQRLYASAGYRSVASFNANPFASFWGEKVLDRPGP
jgi:GNAT superfamily N-acetyltransferase